MSAESADFFLKAMNVSEHEFHDSTLFHLPGPHCIYCRQVKFSLGSSSQREFFKCQFLYV